MIGSWTDWELTELGFEQAKRIGERLAKEIKNDKYIMYSSDLLRTRHTAEIAANFLGIEPIFTEDLREFNFGEACGKTKQWARENGKADSYLYRRTVDEIPFIGAESIRNVWNRLTKFLNRIMAETENNYIIVSHAGTLGIFYALWLGLDIELWHSCELRGEAGGVSFMCEDLNGKRIINRLNDLSYSL
jgi:probable phosphoglycerate mutase